MTIYNLTEAHNGKKALVRSFTNRAAAIAHVEALRPVAFEEDADHPGYFDIFTRSGLVLALEPATA
jgi:hypothetical protein